MADSVVSREEGKDADYRVRCLLSTPEYQRANLEMADLYKKHYRNEKRKMVGKETPAKTGQRI